ncbi:MAG: RNA polymerase subunit sigma-24 [Myxococcales bacterium 68-20]|nr:RNA polymerase sigma factor [Myxococcales bacterium]OJY25695.1 MAG: RNA polymerase subunit sigma-24 [Myxococcales bacterium 68-20]
MSAREPRNVVSAIWRIESAKLIAMLARMIKSVDLAEEIAQEVFIDALTRWETSGVPDNPGGWLMTAAKHRAVDVLRHARRAERKHDQLAQEVETTLAADFDEALDDVVGDDLLRLVFVACHPVLSQEGRVALTLRLLGGLTTDEVARAFLVPESTIAQRITRAKRTLAEKNVPFELPRPEDLAARLESVLEVIYLVFNEGYLATTGDDWMRPALCEDALRLGRILAELVSESEVHGLLSLMEIQASRARARVSPDGEAVLLPDQDRTLWDPLLVRRGLDGLARADAFVRERPGPYFLQAAIAACHARAKSAADTDWARIAALYDALLQVAPSPVVELNRAVALGMAFGPEVGLAVADPLTNDPALRDYPFLPSVRADFLAKLGRFADAKTEVERAAALTKNARERTLLLERAASYAQSDEERGSTNSPPS